MGDEVDRCPGDSARIAASLPATPIVVVDWDGRDEARAVLALNAGADEYVVANTRMLELGARVDAQIRNGRRRALAAVPEPSEEPWTDEPETVTDAPNRQALDRALVRMLREDVMTSLLFVDVDHFRSINEVHGRPAGDRTLSALSRLLHEHTRPGDFVAR